MAYRLSKIFANSIIMFLTMMLYLAALIWYLPRTRRRA